MYIRPSHVLRQAVGTPKKGLVLLLSSRLSADYLGSREEFPDVAQPPFAVRSNHDRTRQRRGYWTPL